MKESITDKDGRRLAIVDVLEESHGHYRGTVIESWFPQEIILLFHKHEHLVNTQVFALLDEIEEKIDACQLYYESKKARIKDLQVMDVDKISFRILDEHDPK